MKVYLFKDYLRLMHDGGVNGSHVIHNIAPITELPDGLISIAGKTFSSCMLSSKDDSFFVEAMPELICKESIDHSENITCPHCGNECDDSFEFGDDGEEECGVCGTVYSFSRHLEVTYSTSVEQRNSNITSMEPINN